MDDISKIRKAIDAADEKIIRALAQRRRLARQAGRAKAGGARPVRDLAREEKLLGRLVARGRKAGVDAHLITRVFHEIIDDSVRAQQHDASRPGRRSGLKIVFQGIEGAYSDLAARKYFGAEAGVVEGFKSFSEAAQAVETGAADYGVLPIENTTAGSINQVYDVLAKSRLSIVGEEVLEVRHCLLALKDIPLTAVRRILSHPQALAQCESFLGKLENCRTESYADTAMAVRKVKEDRDLSQAAIASEEAGRRYGLKVVARSLADRAENYTRFVVVGREPETVAARVACRTSLILSVSHKEGALLDALNVLHEHKINMTKLESRPLAGSPFKYLFYVDFEGNIADPHTAAALDELKAHTSFLKILGSYPKRDRRRARPLKARVKRRKTVKKK
jgi:chorismate mutase/prephenate dehydratase